MHAAQGIKIAEDAGLFEQTEFRYRETSVKISETQRERYQDIAESIRNRSITIPTTSPLQPIPQLREDQKSILSLLLQVKAKREAGEDAAPLRLIVYGERPLANPRSYKQSLISLVTT
jgi:hypothetical protein